MKDDRAYLTHIQEAIASIEEYLEGSSYDDFCSDKIGLPPFYVPTVIRELSALSVVISASLPRRLYLSPTTLLRFVR